MIELPLRALLGWAAFTCLASSARAWQSVLQLRPLPAGADLELVVVDAAAATTAPRPWPSEELGWLYVRESGYQENHARIERRPEAGAALRLERHTAGLALIGWDPRPRQEEVAGAALLAFLEERRGEVALPAALTELAEQPSVRLRRYESLALHVRGARASAACSALATSKTGQRMELRPLLDPARLEPGSDLALRLYLPEGGFDCVLARATELANARHLPVALTADGAGYVRMDAAGAWRIEAHALRRGAGGELELWTSTLVIELASKQPGESGGGR